MPLLLLRLLLRRHALTPAAGTRVRPALGQLCGGGLDPQQRESLVKAVLAWTDQDALTARHMEQIALQLTGHARAVASDVRRRADQLPKDSGPKALADIVLREAEGRLSVPIEGTAPASSAPSTNAWTA